MSQPNTSDTRVEECTTPERSALPTAESSPPTSLYDRVFPSPDPTGGPPESRELARSDTHADRRGQAPGVAAAKSGTSSTLSRFAERHFDLFLSPGFVFDGEGNEATPQPTTSEATPPLSSREALNPPPLKLASPPEVAANIIILGDRESGRTSLFQSLQEYCRKHRSRGEKRTSPSYVSSAPPLATYLQSTCTVPLKLQRVGDTATSAEATVSAIDPGSLDLHKALPCLCTNALSGATLILCVLPLIGVKQVRQRRLGGGLMGSAFRALMGDAEVGEEQAKGTSHPSVIIHEGDVARLRHMLWLSHSIAMTSCLRTTSETGTASVVCPRVVVVGSFMDGLTVSTVKGTREVLSKLEELCKAIVQEDGLSVTVNALFAANLVEGKCLTREHDVLVYSKGLPPTGRSDSSGNRSQRPEMLDAVVPLSHLWSFLLGNVAPVAGTNLTLKDRGPDTTANRVRGIAEAIYGLQRQLPRAPAVVDVDALRHVAFALECDNATLALSDVARHLAVRGDVFTTRWTRKPSELSNSLVDPCSNVLPRALCLDPHGLLRFVSFLELFVTAAQGLGRFPSPVATTSLNSVNAGEAAALRNGVLSVDLLCRIWKHVNAGSIPDSSTAMKTEAGSSRNAAVERNAQHVRALLTFLDLGVPCDVQTDSDSSPVPSVLFPVFMPQQNMCPREALDLARWLQNESASTSPCPSSDGTPFFRTTVFSLTFHECNAPGELIYATLVTALAPFIFGSVFTDALWLTPRSTRHRETGSSTTRGLAHLWRGPQRHECAMELFVFSDHTSPTADVESAMFEKELMDSLTSRLEPLLPLVKVRFTTEETQGEASSPEESTVLRSSALKQLHNIFAESWHGFVVVQR